TERGPHPSSPLPSPLRCRSPSTSREHLPRPKSVPAMAPDRLLAAALGRARPPRFISTTRPPTPPAPPPPTPPHFRARRCSASPCRAPHGGSTPPSSATEFRARRAPGSHEPVHINVINVGPPKSARDGPPGDASSYCRSTTAPSDRHGPPETRTKRS